MNGKYHLVDAQSLRPNGPGQKNAVKNPRMRLRNPAPVRRIVPVIRGFFFIKTPGTGN